MNDNDKIKEKMEEIERLDKEADEDECFEKRKANKMSAIDIWNIKERGLARLARLLQLQQEIEDIKNKT